ncbi:MAG: DUF1080 domain-containing protein [Gemmataceae bacterium]|nr:DUF1080 domain-containing protein [Gemmataceae bacterium]MCI0742492.1 DUF1080 domain-containing protein [Gemmataceae bacterium]
MFDPYHKWLGIPKDQRPPTFYQLLGLAAFETDTEVIDEAAIRQTTHVRAYQIGPQAAECTRILNEISLARQTLLNPAKKKEYDAKLAALAKPAAVADSAAEAFANLVTASPPLTSAQRLRQSVDEDEDAEPPRRRREEVDIQHEGLFAGKRGLVIGISAGGGLLLVAAIVLAIATGGSGEIPPPKVNPPIAEINPKPPVENPPVQPPKVELPIENPPPKVNPAPKPIPFGLGVPIVHELQQWKAPPGSAAVAATANPRQFLIGGHYLSLWDVDQGRFIRTFGKPKSGGNRGALAVYPDGTKFFAATMDDPVIMLWDMKTGQPEAKLEGHESAVMRLALAMDGKLLVSVSQDKSVRLWDTQTFKEVHCWKLHESRVVALAVAPDGRTAFAGGDGGTGFLLDLQERKVLHKWGDRVNRNFDAAFTPDGSKLLAATHGGLAVYSIKPFRREALLTDHSKLAAIVLAPDGQHVFTLGYDHRICQWDWAAHRALRIFEGHTNFVTGMACGSDGKSILTCNGGKDGTVRLWPIEAVAEVAVAPKPKNPDPNQVGKQGALGADGWIQLFNGKDLTGWKINPRYPAGWGVENGVLISHGGTGMLFSERDDFGDFHLRAEVNINAEGDSGIFFRADYAKHAQRSYEAMPSHLAPYLKDAALVRWVNGGKVVGPVRSSIYPVDQWFTIEIIARGSHLMVKIDEKPIVDVVDSEPILVPGHIAVQQWTRETRVRFRKIEIKELSRDVVAKSQVPAGKPAVERVAVPKEDEVKETEKEIRKQFSKEYALAKKTPAEKAAVAERLYELGMETKDNLTKRYVLLAEARDLAAQSGRAFLAIQIVEELGKGFEVDERELNRTALAVVAKLNLSKDLASDLTEAALGLAGACVEDDAFALAFEFWAFADSGARKSQSGALVTQVKNQEKQWREFAKDFEEASSAKEILGKEANNAAAHLTLGKYLALRKGDWDKALAHLAKGGEGALQELARQDLTAPSEPAARAKLAEAWWEAGEKEPGAHKYGLQWRAVHWYRLALPMLAGITQSEVAAKIKKFEEQPSPFRSALGELRRFKGHTAEVTSLALSQDGKRLCSGSSDGTLRTWNVSTAKLLHTLPTSAPVAGFALSPDQRHAFVCAKSAGVIVVDMKSGVVVYPKGAGNFRECVPGGIWLGPERIYYAARNDFHTADLRGGGGAGPLPGAPVHAMIAAAEARQYVTLSESGAVELHRIPGEGGRLSQGMLGNFDAHAGAFSDDGKLLALGGKDHSVRLWKLTSQPKKSKETPLIFEGHTGPVRAVAISSDGKRLLSGGDDKIARVWDIASGKEIHRFTQHTGPVLAVLFTPDGRFALSAGADATIRMWSVPR